MRHILLADGRLHGADAPACVLALQSRGGPIAGDRCRRERDELAALVGPALAELLRSGRPIVVRSDRAEAWEVVEVTSEGA